MLLIINMSELPDETLLHIFSFLDKSTKKILCQVNKELYFEHEYLLIKLIEKPPSWNRVEDYYPLVVLTHRPTFQVIKKAENEKWYNL